MERRQEKGAADGVVSSTSPDGGLSADSQVGTTATSECRSAFRTRDEDQVGKLHAAVSPYPPQHGAGEEDAGVPGVCRRSRDGSSLGGQPQQALCPADGSVHARLAAVSSGTESTSA